MNLNFDRLSVPPAHFVCTRDILGVQLVVAPDTFDGVLLEAKRLAATFIDAHAYCSFPRFPPLDLMAESWFAVVGVGPRNTVFGYADSSLNFVPLVPGHSDNQPFIEASRVMRLINAAPGVGPALADFRAARQQTGSYVAFFAYRVLEDVGYTFGTKDDKPNWVAMNSALGTTERHWGRLTEAGTAARHNPAGAIDSRDREELLAVAKDALDKKLALLAQR
jgi:hypothetical protein